MRTLTLLVSAFLLVGCTISAPKGGGKDKGEVVKNDDNGNEEKKNPDALQAEIDAMKPVDPVDFRKLVEVLPPAPAGFKAEEPDGVNFNVGELKYSHATRKYQKDDQSIEVLIQDAAHNKDLYAAWMGMRKISIDTAKNYTKSITIDGNPGYEHYELKEKNGSLNVLVGKRFLVHVNVRGVDAEMMQSVYKAIDTKKLAAMK